MREKFLRDGINLSNKAALLPGSPSHLENPKEERRRPKGENNADKILYDMSAQLSKVLCILKPSVDLAQSMSDTACMPTQNTRIMNSVALHNTRKTDTFFEDDSKFDVLDGVILDLINRVNCCYPQICVGDNRGSNETVDSFRSESISLKNLDDYGNCLQLTSFQSDRRTSGQEELEKIEKAVENMLLQVQLQEDFLGKDVHLSPTSDCFLERDEIPDELCQEAPSDEELQFLSQLIPSSKSRTFDHSMPRCLKKYKTRVGLNSGDSKNIDKINWHQQTCSNRLERQGAQELYSSQSGDIQFDGISNPRPQSYLFHSIWYETQQRAFEEPNKFSSDTESYVSTEPLISTDLIPKYPYSSDAIDLTTSSSSQGDWADQSSLAECSQNDASWAEEKSISNVNPNRLPLTCTYTTFNRRVSPFECDFFPRCSSDAYSSLPSLSNDSFQYVASYYPGKHIAARESCDMPVDCQTDPDVCLLRDDNDFKSLHVEYFTPSEANRTVTNSGYCMWYSHPDFFGGHSLPQDLNVPVSRAVTSISLKENRNVNPELRREERLGSNTLISVKDEKLTPSDHQLRQVESDTDNFDLYQTSTTRRHPSKGIQEAATLTLLDKEIVAPEAPESRQQSSTTEFLISVHPGHAAVLHSSQSEEELKPSPCANGSIPSLPCASAISDVSKVPLGFQVEKDSLSSKLIDAAQFSPPNSSADSAKVSSHQDFSIDESVNVSMKSLQDNKTPLDSFMSQTNSSVGDGISNNINLNIPSNHNQSKELKLGENVESIDALDVSSLKVINDSEKYLDESNSNAPPNIGKTFDLRDSSASSIIEKIQNSAKEASENLILTRAEEVADLEIRGVPPLHRGVVDEVLVNSFELPDDEQSKDRFIDMLIKQETEKLALSNNESDVSSDESMDNDVESDFSVGVSGVTSNLKVPSEKPTAREKSVSSSDDDVPYIVEEPTSKKNVTFKLDFRGRRGSNDEDNVEFEELTEDEEEPEDYSEEENLSDERTEENEFNPVERKFERMASETLDEVEKTNPAFDREYQRIVSQLSNEEVDECLLIWDECEFTPTAGDRRSKCKQSKDAKNPLPKEAGSDSPDQFESTAGSVISSQQDFLNGLINESHEFPSSVYWSFEPSPQTTPKLKKRPISPIIHPTIIPCTVGESPLGSTYGAKSSYEETNRRDPQAVDEYEQLTSASTIPISSPPSQVHFQNQNVSSSAAEPDQRSGSDAPETEKQIYSVKSTKKFWEKMSSSSTSSDETPEKNEVPTQKPETVARSVKPIPKQRTTSLSSSVSTDDGSRLVDFDPTATAKKSEVEEKSRSAEIAQSTAVDAPTDLPKNVTSSDAELSKESPNRKSVDSETEYIEGHPSEYFSYENPALNINSSDLGSRFPAEKECNIYDKRYSECLNEIPPVSLPRKTIYDRSASLPTSDLSDESVRSRKRIFESQLKKEMVVDQLMIQLEEESSLEYKTISGTESAIAEVSQENMIDRQIHTDIFSSEINEEIYSSAPEHKEISLEEPLSKGVTLKDDKEKRDTSITVDSSDVTDKIITDSTHKISNISSCDESSISKNISQPSSTNQFSSNTDREKWETDPGTVHVDKSEIELTEKEIDKDGDLKPRSQESCEEPVPSITHSLSEKQSSDSSSSAKSGDTANELKNKQICDPLESDKVTSILIDKQVVCTPEEHVPDTVWEVPIQENEQEVYDQGIPIEAQEKYDGGQTVDEDIDSSDVKEKEIRTMAEGVIADIESVLSGKNIDFLSSNVAQSKLTEFLESMHESGVDKTVGKELIESVLAKKHRESIRRMFRADTNTSSVEITDEDLKSTGAETDLSLQDFRVQVANEAARKSSYEDFTADVFEKSSEDAPTSETSNRISELQSGSTEGEGLERGLEDTNDQQIETSTRTSTVTEKKTIFKKTSESSESFSVIGDQSSVDDINPSTVAIDHSKEETFKFDFQKSKVEVGEAVFLDSYQESTPEVEVQKFEAEGSAFKKAPSEELDEPASESSGTAADYNQGVSLSDQSKEKPKKRTKPTDSMSRRSGTDFDACSSSSESCYQSVEQTDTKTPSRPLSSDVEALLAGAAGTAGSSEYESAVSREISSRSNIGTSSHDYHTAVSSLSSRESMKSLSSESSGNMASVEISSEASETLIASTLELDRDDVMSATTVDEDEFKSHQVFEPYDMDIPAHVICSESSPFKTRKQDTYDDDYDSEEAHRQGMTQRMKRSHEMTFQPEPQAIIPENQTSDSVLQTGALTSSTDDPVSSSFASSSSDMTSSKRTVMEMPLSDFEKRSGTSEQWGVNISGSSDQFSLSSESKEESLTTPATVGVVTTETGDAQTCTSVTMISSHVSENGVESVSTQVTSEGSSIPQPEFRSKIPQPSSSSTDLEHDAESDFGKKVGHRRTESTSILLSRIPIATRGDAVSPIKFPELQEDVAESDRYSEQGRKCISALDRRELEERYEESLHTEADQGFYRDIREGKILLDEGFPTDDDFREFDSRPHSQISKSDSESGQRLPSSTFSDDRPDSELACLLQQGSSDGAFEDPIERPATPEPPATPETSDIFDRPPTFDPTDKTLYKPPNCLGKDDLPESPPFDPSPDAQFQKERVHEFSSSPELESCLQAARDKTPFQHNGDYEEELAEAEAAFHVVPRLTPAVPSFLPPTIPEDPAAEKDELEEREQQLRKAALCPAKRRSVGSIPDITVTQHMAPLDDKDFQYPDLENELAVKEDSAAASMSSKTSSETTETDQGQEYVVNDDETSCTTGEVSATTEEKTVLEAGKIPKLSKNDDEKQSTTDSTNSDSFELVEKPDLIDDFVVVEEVAKEVNEQDTEGKSVSIKKRVIGKVTSSKNAEDIDETLGEEEDARGEVETTQTGIKTAKMTSMTYYGAGGMPEDLSLPLDESPTDKHSPTSDPEFKDDLEDGKKWLEMQFEGATTTTVDYGFEGEFSHAPLEDIKEEDAVDLDSSKVGSAGSQISQSFGSLGSDKKSLSSTPEYDVLAGKKYFSKSNEHDTISVSSLQEFEKLEQLMAVEALKKSQGSQDSLNTWSSGSKKPHHSYDNISFTSLKEYEGLELACIEAELVKKKAIDEEVLLSQIEEGHESQASESESCETISAMKGNDSNSEDYEKRMFEIDEIIRQAQSNVEQFAERTESMGRGDSLEEVARVPELELDKPLVSPIRVQPEIYSGKKFIQQWPDVDDEMALSTDSLDFKSPISKARLADQMVSSADSLELKSDVMSASTDSIEFQQKQKKQSLMHDSLELDLKAPSKSVLETYEGSGGYEPESEDSRQSFKSKFLDSSNTTVISRVDVMGSSTDSLEPSSSAGTHATYHYENESLMSSSAGSNTLMSSAENLENAAKAGRWFEDGRPYVTEKIEPLEGDEEGFTHTIHRTVEMPPQIHKVTFTGPNAEKALQDYIDKFGPGEDVSETQVVDSEGQLHIKRVIQRRVVLAPEDIQAETEVDSDSYSKSTERTALFPGTERQSSDDTSDFSSSVKSSLEFHLISSHHHSPTVLESRGLTNIPYSDQALQESETGRDESEKSASNVPSASSVSNEKKKNADGTAQ